MVGTLDLKTDVFFLRSMGWHTLHRSRGLAITVRMRTTHPCRYQATMGRCFGLVTPHQHGIADTCRGAFFLKYNAADTEKSRFEDLRG